MPDYSLSYDEKDLQNISLSVIMNNSKIDKTINDSFHDISMVKDMNNLSSLN